MSAINETLALEMVKTRLNRLQTDTSLDSYLAARIRAAAEELEATGIVLTDSTADLLLVVDYAVWQYQNRDANAGMPYDIRKRRLERWVPGNKGGS